MSIKDLENFVSILIRGSNCDAHACNIRKPKWWPEHIKFHYPLSRKDSEDPEKWTKILLLLVLRCFLNSTTPKKCGDNQDLKDNSNRKVLLDKNGYPEKKKIKINFSPTKLLIDEVDALKKKEHKLKQIQRRSFEVENISENADLAPLFLREQTVPHRPENNNNAVQNHCGAPKCDGTPKVPTVVLEKMEVDKILSKNSPKNTITKKSGKNRHEENEIENNEENEQKRIRRIKINPFTSVVQTKNNTRSELVLQTIGHFMEGSRSTKTNSLSRQDNLTSSNPTYSIVLGKENSFNQNGPVSPITLRKNATSSLGDQRFEEELDDIIDLTLDDDVEFEKDSSVLRSRLRSTKILLQKKGTPQEDYQRNVQARVSLKNLSNGQTITLRDALEKVPTVDNSERIQINLVQRALKRSVVPGKNFPKPLENIRTVTVKNADRIVHISPISPEKRKLKISATLFKRKKKRITSNKSSELRKYLKKAGIKASEFSFTPRIVLHDICETSTSIEFNEFAQSVKRQNFFSYLKLSDKTDKNTKQYFPPKDNFTAKTQILKIPLTSKLGLKLMGMRKEECFLKKIKSQQYYVDKYSDTIFCESRDSRRKGLRNIPKENYDENLVERGLAHLDLSVSPNKQFEPPSKSNDKSSKAEKYSITEITTSTIDNCSSKFPIVLLESFKK